ncbi:hypothetical protein DL93DRAFT_1964877 [Clavulina sp. PMI_390]|nr:hypothetical protein DL93DRAFT_1964877 [Clavulina sp. PMI_390]
MAAVDVGMEAGLAQEQLIESSMSLQDVTIGVEAIERISSHRFENVLQRIKRHVESLVKAVAEETFPEPNLPKLLATLTQTAERIQEILALSKIQLYFRRKSVAWTLEEINLELDEIVTDSQYGLELEHLGRDERIDMPAGNKLYVRQFTLPAQLPKPYAPSRLHAQAVFETEADESDLVFESLPIVVEPPPMNSSSLPDLASLQQFVSSVSLESIGTQPSKFWLDRATRFP